MGGNSRLFSALNWQTTQPPIPRHTAGTSPLGVLRKTQKCGEEGYPLFNRKKPSEYRNVVECKTTLPSDGLWDDDIPIRPDGINISDIIASHLYKNDASINNYFGDNEHHCWILEIKWKNKYFKLRIYNFHDVMIIVSGSKGSPVYIELIELLHYFLVDDDRFTEITWMNDKEKKQFSTPT